MKRRSRWDDCVCGHSWDWHGPGKDCIAGRTCGCMVYRLGDWRP